MKKKPLVTILLLAVNFGLLGFLVYHATFKERFAYINIQKVFHDFDYKIELEKKLSAEKAKKEQLIDSLLTDLRLLSMKLENEKKPSEAAIIDFREKQRDFQQRKKIIEEESQALADAYDKQIIEQMNQYIMDYGKSKNFKFIFGSDGKGNIMYANEADEVTSEVIAFINQKYKGLN